MHQTTAAEQKILKIGANEWKYLDTAEGPAKDWHKADFDDANWEETDYSHGSYWRCLGPEAAVSTDLELILAGDVDTAAEPWERYAYSQIVGHANPEVYGIMAGAHGLDEIVSLCATASRQRH